MAIMSANRRMNDKKQRDANKAKAHADNHKKAKAAQALIDQIKTKPEAVKDGSDKSASK